MLTLSGEVRTYEDAQVFTAYDIQSICFITTRSLVMVTLQCTHHDLSVNNGNAVLDELMHADAVMNELMDALHTINNFPVTEDSAHRSRTSGGVSKGVHRVSGSLWRRLSAIMDSGSAECVATESIAKDGKWGVTSRTVYHTADGGV